LGTDKSTMSRWLQKYRRGGLSELLFWKKAPGQVPPLTHEALAGGASHFGKYIRRGEA
jgi:hypothetical protein